MRTRYLIGIEFEYLLTSKNDYSADGLRFYKNIAVKDLSTVLENRPGAGDPTLYHDSEGVKNGYWYVEGVERYTREGKLLDQAVKGLEVRTPPTTSIGAALNQLLRLEHQLRVRLMRTGLDLAVAAYHPTAPPYVFDPPLAAWEEARRLILPECRLADVAMLTYGPDLNFSLPDWSETQLGNAWEALAANERARQPSARLFRIRGRTEDHPLLRPARASTERGRFEYKAFDAAPSAHLLGACSALVLGLLLDQTLPQRCFAQPQSLYDRVAFDPFGDSGVIKYAEIALRAAKCALFERDLMTEFRRLDLLETMLRTKRTPAQDALGRYELTGQLVHYGGLDLKPLEINNTASSYTTKVTKFKSNNSNFARAIKTQCS
ncbi:hypothetical protein EVAR_91965_1 [Eumeta japonica]|uniref:Glutamate--cysteine ligase n=1 Tax=Eumeta variegata TaxID=151549 RepID=A0A4C1SCQ6_EUMVA|nr:hypothetical protein EVAR_91965_1 [Eumeta japonica]